MSVILQYVFTLLTCLTAIRGQCAISTRDELPKIEPLILNPGVALEFRYPNKNGTLEFSRNDAVRLVCNGRGNRFVNLGNESAAINDIIVACKSGNQFDVSGEIKEFKDLECTKWPFVEQRQTGSCFGSNINYEIGFGLKDKFKKLIEVCYDPIKISTLFTRFALAKEISGSRYSQQRPHFMNCPNPLISCDDKYKRRNQIETIGRILGSADEGQKYIKNSSEDYLARGHLAANADFIYNSQKRATFYYINQAPQWQRCNAHGWADLERNVRTFASASNQDLIVYTGVHGIAQLPNKDNISTDLYLSYASDGTTSMPVPRFFWKVIYNEKTKLGTAFVQVNNPWLDAIPRSYRICRKLKQENTRWHKWSDANLDCTSYICEVDDLRNFVKFPQFPVTGLLV